MTGIDVDPSELVEFAGTADTAEWIIRNTDLLDALLDTASGVPGSATEYALRSVVGAVRAPMADLADDFAAMSRAVRNAAAGFDATDAALAEHLNRIAVP
ncbi:hypothetical protein GCM10009624_14190 [Gordonia sinesedis]